MKILLAVLSFFLVLARSYAQNDFQQCAAAKNSIMSQLLVRGKLDSTDRETYLLLNDSWKNCIMGRTMPAFEARTLEGTMLSSASMAGKIIVLDFWFMACPPCIAELPELNQLVADYRDKNVIFLGGTIDTRRALRHRFLPKYRFDFTILPEADDLEDSFGILNHPTIFIIDRSGKAAAAWEGADADEDEKNSLYLKLKRTLDHLLGQ